MKIRLALFVLLLGGFISGAYFFQQKDLLTTLLKQKEFSADAALLGLVTAFFLGTVHALSPGHGKALVAAYLAGSRGTIRHAVFLGGVVTFTHTISVFLLGFAMLFLSQYIFPEKIVPWLGTISGVSIIVVGLLLLRNRLMSLMGKETTHQHFGHSHSHTHEVASGHEHIHAIRLPAGETNFASLIALGVSGGLVPCPSALVLLLSAIAIGRTGFGLLLLLSFSLGLALVLIGIGGVVLYAKDLISWSPQVTGSRVFQWLPVVTAIFIVGIGCLMTGISVGIFPPLGVD